MSAVTLKRNIMSSVSLVNNQVFTPLDIVDGPFNSNGQYHIYQSSKINTANSLNGLEVVVKYSNELPYRDGTIPIGYNLSCIIETQNDQGDWHPIHSQFAEFTKSNQEVGNEIHILTIDPTINAYDINVPIDVSNGSNIIARESKKQRRLGDNFRICVVLNESKFGEAGEFQSINLSISYEVYGA